MRVETHSESLWCAFEESYQIIELNLIPKVFTHLNSHGTRGVGSKWGCSVKRQDPNGRQIPAICRRGAPTNLTNLPICVGLVGDLYAGCGRLVTLPLIPQFTPREQPATGETPSKSIYQ